MQVVCGIPQRRAPSGKDLGDLIRIHFGGKTVEFRTHLPQHRIQGTFSHVAGLKVVSGATLRDIIGGQQTWALHLKAPQTSGNESSSGNL